jgi:hypothetical protein
MIVGRAFFHKIGRSALMETSVAKHLGHISDAGFSFREPRGKILGLGLNGVFAEGRRNGGHISDLDRQAQIVGHGRSLRLSVTG